MASVAGVVASGTSKSQCCYLGCMNSMRIVAHNFRFALTVARAGQNSRRQKWQLITRLPACAQLYFTFEFRGVTLLSTDYTICQHWCV